MPMHTIPFFIIVESIKTKPDTKLKIKWVRVEYINKIRMKIIINWKHF